MINDFGFVIKMDSSHETKSRIVEDYRKILNAFMTATDRGWVKNEPQSYDVVSLFIKKLSDKILKHLFNYDDEALIVNTIIHEFFFQLLSNHFEYNNYSNFKKLYLFVIINYCFL